MKKVLALVLTLILVISLSACGSDNGSGESKESKESIIEKYGLKHINKGDTVRFGNYEQDNNTANGGEEIEWIVLEKDNDSLFLVSQYILDYQQFNTEQPSTWDICSLRKWLNDDFLNAAFTEGEQDMIENSNVKAERFDTSTLITKGDTSPGSDTRDKIFLLSVSEVETYFSSEAQKCLATKYAESLGAINFMGSTEWWTRSTGLNTNLVNYYTKSYGWQDGGVDKFKGIRPAMWIDLATE